MADHSGSVIESQVDWLTVSAHGEVSAGRMLDYARSLAKEEVRRGARRRPFRLMGYEGEHIGRIEYGQRDNASALLRLIGESAAENLDQSLSLADTVTRVDLATTWRADPPDEYMGRNTYALAELFYRANPKAARPSFTGDSDGGFTCYLGSRESQSYLRVYNKEAECIAKGDDEGVERYRACWRYELECKASLAGAMAHTVAERQDRPDYVREYLASFLDAHGIAAPFVTGAPMSLLKGFRRRADAESRLRHLARNVKPTVTWLRSEGRENQVRDALGFDSGEASLRELQYLLST